MRFKNLTITITLGCLSVVALTGLVMLPITGNCELHQHGWTLYSKNTAANIIVTEDTKGASWQVFGSVDAKSVSASLYPDDHNLGLFTEELEEPFSGTGKVTAVRHGYLMSHYHYPHFYYTPWLHMHIVLGDIDTNKTDSPYYNGENTALVLDIDIDAKVEKHTVLARKKETDVSITVTLGNDDLVVLKDAQFTVGQTTYVAMSKSDKVMVETPAVERREGVKVEVDFDSRADSSAHADFDFEGNDFDEGSVWYYAP